MGQQVRPDVVYFRTGLDILPIWLGRLLKARTVLEVNADPAGFFQNEGALWWARLVRVAERLNARSSDLVIALTPGLKQVLVERYRLSPHKIVVIPSGTDPDHFTAADLQEAKARLGLQPDQPVVGFVGIFYRHQGVHTLIEALPRILAERPTTRLLLVGDGVMRPHWEALARQLGVLHAITFTGQVPYQEVPRYLQAMDVVVAPFTTDRGETSPFKILDALASERPVIASDLSSIRRLAQGFGGAITLVPPEEPETLAQVVLELLCYPGKREVLGRRGREGILRHYTWPEVARRTREEVRRLIDDPLTARLASISEPGAVRSALSRITREGASWAPRIGIIPRSQRPQGISAIMRVKDEETWLELSIRSLAPVADEILVGDNGSRDRTRDILEGLRQEWPNRLLFFHRPDLDIRDLTNFLIERTRFRWILRWDADFVARTEGPHAIRSLRETLLSLDPRRYCFAYLAMLELCGDLFHQRPGTATRADCHGFMYSDHLRYVYDPTGYEAPAIPRWYKVLRFELPTFFHLDVKPTRRMFLSWLWKRFLTEPERHRYPGFEAYVETQLKQRWGGNSLEEAAGLWAASAFRELVPYDRERWGDYPTLLKPFLEEPTYRLLYQDGQIVGREEGDPACT
jgi:glycosyltransferase involved in cell wall biosynthesis